MRFFNPKYFLGSNPPHTKCQKVSYLDKEGETGRGIKFYQAPKSPPPHFAITQNAAIWMRTVKRIMPEKSNRPLRWICSPQRIPKLRTPVR